MLDDPNEPRYTNADAREILKRALKIDSQRNASLTASELHYAAKEVGIGRESLSAAIEMFETESSNVPSRRKSLKVLILSHAACGLLTGVAWVTSGRFLHLPVSLSWALIFLLSGGAAFTVRRVGRLKALADFQVKNAALFGGSFLGMVGIRLASDWLAGIAEADHLALFTFYLWATSAGLGGLIALWRGRQSYDAHAPSGASFLSKTREAIRVRLVGWINRIFAQSRGFRSRMVSAGNLVIARSQNSH